MSPIWGIFFLSKTLDKNHLFIIYVVYKLWFPWRGAGCQESYMASRGILIRQFV